MILFERNNLLNLKKKEEEDKYCSRSIASNALGYSV